jgi:tetratricopeptide (TPR) repeat protein
MIRAAILFHLGFYDDSERDAREALLANPAYAMAMQALGVVTLYRGDYAAANEYFDRCLALEPALLLGNIFAPIAPILMGRLDLAREKIRKARQMVPEEPQLTCLDALIAAQEGDFPRAEQLADEASSAKRKSITHTHHTWHHAAAVYALCGKPEKAMPQLRRCAELGLPNYRLFTSDPTLRPLKDHPEFGDLMTELRRQHDRHRAEFSLSDTTH